MPEGPLLSPLVDELEAHMKELGYAEETLYRYRLLWDDFIQFACDDVEDRWHEALGILYLKEKHGIDMNAEPPSLTSRQREIVRSVRLIGDFHLHHAVVRHFVTSRPEFILPELAKIREQFVSYCAEGGYSKTALGKYDRYAKDFFEFLSSRKLAEISRLNAEVVTAYVNTFAGLKKPTIAYRLSVLRLILRFLQEHGFISADLVDGVTLPRIRPQASLPSTWSTEELKRLFESIDRDNPIGKRNYAIILIACRLGLRMGDICGMRFENIDWTKDRISLVQSKTGNPVDLPLPSDVGWAIIDYLKHGRPKCGVSTIFVSHKPPYGRLSPEGGGGLWQQIQQYMRKAGIDRRGKKSGMHSFRHTLSGVLLEQETPLPVISEILGHADVRSTEHYLKISIARLKECPLEIEEALSDDESQL